MNRVGPSVLAVLVGLLLAGIVAPTAGILATAFGFALVSALFAGDFRRVIKVALTVVDAVVDVANKVYETAGTIAQETLDDVHNAK